jgi:hypothetical protein
MAVPVDRPIHPIHKGNPVAHQRLFRGAAQACLSEFDSLHLYCYFQINVVNLGKQSHEQRRRKRNRDRFFVPEGRSVRKAGFATAVIAEWDAPCGA